MTADGIRENFKQRVQDRPTKRRLKLRAEKQLEIHFPVPQPGYQLHTIYQTCSILSHKRGRETASTPP